MIARKAWIGIGVVFGLLVVLVVGIALFFDLNRYKPQISAAVEKSTGMRLKMGDASLGFFPRIGIALRDVHLTRGGSELFEASEVRIAPRLAPLIFRREVVLNRMSLVRALSIKNGQLVYLDRQSGRKVEVAGVDADLSGITQAAQGEKGGETKATNPMASLSFKGDVRAKSLKAGALAVTDLKARVTGDRGLVVLDPTEATLFGGAARGSARVDLRGVVPTLQVTQKIEKVGLDQISKSRMSGVVAASVNLSASGKDGRALTRTARGEVSVRGKNLDRQAGLRDRRDLRVQAEDGKESRRCGERGGLRSLLFGATGYLVAVGK